MFSFAKTFTRSVFPTLRANYSTKPNPMQKIIMMCGPPGVGKGTYSRLLAEDFGYTQISTGDEIRKILKNNGGNSGIRPPLLAQLKRYMKAGKLIPDEIMMEILYNRIKEPGASRGVILDGFPRTSQQLKMFTQVFPINLVININQCTEYLMASILGRHTCMDCGTSYSAFSYYKDGYELDVMMPRKEGVCDNCGGCVRVRDDDKKEVVEMRLKEYEAKTFPLIEEMDAKGVPVIHFDAKRGIRDYPRLQQIIVSRVGLPYYYHHYHSSDYIAPEIYH